MSFALPTGVVSLSIVLELDPQRRGLDQPRSLEAVTDRLVQLLARYQVPATWAVADPAISAATDRLVAAEQGHELAILGDQTWVGRVAGRSRFAKELNRRVTRGREAGLAISTLALRDVELGEDHVDLVTKNALSVVRTTFRPEDGRRWFRRPEASGPQSLRFGLWEISPAQQLPGNSRWWPGGGGGHTARRAMDRAATRREAFHLTIDGLLLATGGRSSERVLEKVLRHATRLRDRGQIQIATLASVATQLTGEHRATPARSILRPAA